MRKYLIALTAAAALSLAGCGTFGGGGGTVADSKFVVAVKAFTTTACGYVPTTATVKELFENGYATTVAALANLICDAVRPLQTGARRAGLPKVGNVTIRGYWAK